MFSLRIRKIIFEISPILALTCIRGAEIGFKLARKSDISAFDREKSPNGISFIK